ncbi:PP2C family protein-serine/threonine phosphatase [Planctomycetota bacterium]
MRIAGIGQTDVGMRRERNEDAFFCDDELGLYLVCDGMGGHQAGNVASFVALHAAVQTVRQGRQTLAAVRNGALSHDHLLHMAMDAADAAGTAVHAKAQEAERYGGMGCTLTMLIVAGAKAAMAHVGDSRLYLHRDDSTEQLSTDHTMAEQLRQRGMLTAAEAKASRFGHVLTRSLGVQSVCEVEGLVLDVEPDDTYLICSDGLSDCFDGLAEVSAYLDQDDLHSIPGALIDLAKRRGGADNITAVVLRAKARFPGQERPAVNDNVRRKIAALKKTQPDRASSARGGG